MDYKTTNFNLVYNIFTLLVLINYAIKREFFSITVRVKKPLIVWLDDMVALGYINSYRLTRRELVRKKGSIIVVLFVTITFKYYQNFSALTPFVLISRPSHFVTVTSKRLKTMCAREATNQAYFLLSTSKGLMLHTKALENKLGGVLIAKF